MTFQQELIDSAESFLNTLGSEAIIYLPAGGGERPIDAIVDRDQPAELGDAPHGHAPLAVIAIRNDETEGISSAELDTGGDKVRYAVRLGKDPQDRRITGIISQDAGMLRLEVR